MSFKISGSIRNTKNLFKKLEAIKTETFEGQIGAVQDATFLIHGTAVKLLQDNDDGTPQIRYNPKRVVLASKPGDAPNTDTGRAVKSIKFDFLNKGFTGRVGTNLRYLRDLEFGTRRMEARPWLSTAIKMASKDIGKIFSDALKKSLQKGSKK